MAIKVITVRSAREKAQFVNLPNMLHKHHRDWERPKLQVNNVLFDYDNNPFLSKSTVKRFIALNDGKIVGRITGIVDQNYIDSCGEAVGLFAFFDSIDNNVVATALFNTASQWLREREMVKILGPAYPSPHIIDGLLIDGFSFDPYYIAPWNQNYYKSLFESSGFQKANDYQSWRVTADANNESSNSIDDVEANNSSISFMSYSVVKKHKKPIPDDIWRKFTSINSSNGGELIMSHGETDLLRNLYRNMLSPCQVTVAEFNNTPVGMAIIIPDYYDAHILSRGRISPIRNIIFQWNKQKHRKGRLAFIQVSKNQIDSDLKGELLKNSILHAAENNLQVTEIASINEDDVELQKILGNSNYKKYKTFRLYHRPLRQA